MKKIMVISFCCLFMLCGCMNGSKKKVELPNESEKENLSAITTDIYDISPVGATIVITDKSKNPYIYGEWYKIEKEENGLWLELETKAYLPGFDSIGHPVDENHEVKFVMDWEWLYGKLDVGSYRIVKIAYDQFLYIPFGIATTS